MNSQKVMRMKKLYKEQKGIKKLEDIYYMSTDIVTNRFSTMFSMLDEVLELANITLGTGKDVDINQKLETYNKYIEFEEYFNEVMEEMKMIKTGKHIDVEKYITEYKKMYFKIILNVLGKKSSKSERSAYVTFLVASEIIKYRKFVSDYVQECFEELAAYHNEVSDVLLMLNDTDDEEEQEVVKEIDVDRHDISYIGKVKDLERMAKELGFVLKSQNGSHKKYENPDTHQCVTIPYHGSKDIGQGLSKLIQKQLMDGCIA